MSLPPTVIPAQAAIQKGLKILDSRFHGNDKGVRDGHFLYVFQYHDLYGKSTMKRGGELFRPFLAGGPRKQEYRFYFRRDVEIKIDFDFF